MANTGQIGSIAGGAIIGIGIGFLTGNPLLGAKIGFMAGAMLGSALFPTTADVPDAQKPSPSGIQITSSSYGLPIAVVFGTKKIGGNLLYYGNFQTIPHVTETEAGGKGGGGGGSTTYTTHYTYSVTLAIGLCMGPADVLRIWAGNTLIDKSAYTVYDGTQITSDSNLVSAMTAEGKTRFPVWKNLCYVVFPNFDLGGSSNVPNFTFEVRGEISDDEVDSLSLLGYQNIETIETSEDSSVSVGEHGVTTIYIWKNFLWFNYRQKVCKYSLSDFSLVATYTMDYDGAYRGMVVDDTYIYLTTNSYGLSILRYYVSDGTFKDATSLWGATAYGRSGLTQDDDYLYFAFGGWASGNNTVRRLDKATMSVSDTLNNTSHYMYSSGAVLADNNGYLYLMAGEWYNGIFLIKFQLSDQSVIWTDEKIDGTNCYPLMSKFDMRQNKILLPSYYYHPPEYPLENALYELNISTSDPTYKSRVSETGVYEVGVAFKDNNEYWIVEHKEGEKIKLRQYIARDVPPTFVSRRILTNSLYGLGWDESTYLKTDTFLDTQEYCVDNDMLVSMSFEKQMSILDVLEYIIGHHNGYITYYDGMISHNQLKAETPIASYTDEYTVKDGNTLPIDITKKGLRDLFNKIIVEFTKRANDYNIATAIDDDSLDIRRFGLKPQTVKLDGLMTQERAQVMATLMLRKTLFNPRGLSFILGPKSLGLKPGEVITYTNALIELIDFDIRILSIGERDDYKIEVEAEEEGDGIHDVVSYGEDTFVSTETPDLCAEASGVVNPIMIEVHPHYTQGECILAINSSKPDEIQWAGATLYKSYINTGSFASHKRASFSGVVGEITDVGIDDDGNAYIEAQFTYDYTFSSASDLDTLLTSPKLNLFVAQGDYGDVYFRFQDATLVDTMKWRFSGIIFDCTGLTLLNSTGSMATGDLISLYNQVQFFPEMVESDKHRELYFKIASFNFRGQEQDLSDVDVLTKEILALCDKPLALSNIQINDVFVTNAGSITVDTGDIDLTLYTRNRKNQGFSTYVADTPDDVDFIEFKIVITKDDDTVLRTIFQSDKTYSYTEALQTEDGGPFSTYKFNVYQRSGGEFSDVYVITVNLV